MGRVFMGVLIGALGVVAGVIAWLSYGKVPVAVTDPPFPMERVITHIPLNARIQKEMVKMPPVLVNEQNLVAGARIYADKCAVCHGFHGKPSDIGPNMYPAAPPLWKQHKNSSVIGVSDDPPGETFWKIKNGIRLTGMPTYRNELTDTEIWQVSLLLANADKPLPPAALQILRVEPAVHASSRQKTPASQNTSPWWKDLSSGGQSGSTASSDSSTPQ